MELSANLKKYLDLESQFLKSEGEGDESILTAMDKMWYHEISHEDRTYLNSRSIVRGNSLQFEVTSILILRGRTSADRIFLNTTLPPCTYPFKDSPTPSFQVMSGLAERYCEAHFPGIPYSVQLTDSGIS